MSSKSPLLRVNDEFGGKDKLVDRIVALLPTGDEPKEDLRKRLLGAANKKLIRMHGIATKVKEKFGSRDKLLDAAAAALGRSKDKDYVEKMGSFSTGQLLDVYRSAERRNGGATPPAKAAKPAGAPVAKAAPKPKAEAKPAAAKAKPAAKPAKSEPKAKAKAAAKKKK